MTERGPPVKTGIARSPEMRQYPAMTISPVARDILRNLCTTITLVGLCLLGLVVLNAYEDTLAAKYFPEIAHTARHRLFALLLALPVPLHVIFIGLIIQKRWLTPPMARFAWIGITASGLWLGAALAVKLFVL